MGETPETGKNTDDQVEDSSVEADASSKTIDAEFEPVEDTPEAKPTASEKPAEKTGPGWGALFTTGAFSSIIGAAIAMVASGTTGVDTAKFAPAEISNQISAIEKVQLDLNERMQKIWGTISELETRQQANRVEFQAEIEDRVDTERALREEVEILTSHLETLFAPIAEASPATSVEITPASENDQTSETPATEPQGEDAEPKLSPNQTPLLNLFARMDSLESKLESFAEATSEGTQTSPALPVVSEETLAQIAEMTARLKELETANSTYSLAAEARDNAISALKLSLTQTQKSVQDLQGEVGSLQTTLKTTVKREDIAQSLQERAVGVMGTASLALSQLEANAQRGKPFPMAWDNLNRALPRDANVAALKDIAHRGAPPLDELKAEFLGMEETLTSRVNSQTKDDGWDWARKAFGGVVSFRKTDGENMDNAGYLHNIGKAMRADKLSEAVANAKAINGQLAVELEKWLVKAERRMTLDGQVDQIRRTILSNSGNERLPAAVKSDTQDGGAN